MHQYTSTHKHSLLCNFRVREMNPHSVSLRNEFKFNTLIRFSLFVTDYSSRSTTVKNFNLPYE